MKNIIFSQRISIAHNLTDQLDIHVVLNFFEEKPWGGLKTKRSAIFLIQKISYRSNRFYLNYD